MTAAEKAATLTSPRVSAAARTGRAAAGHQPARPDERHPDRPARHAAPALRHVISISSGAGLVAFEYSSAHAASKFGLESWMGALEQEITPFGIHTTIINPGWFRTDLVRMEPELWPEQTIDDYAERSATQRAWWEARTASSPAIRPSWPGHCSPSAASP